MAVNPNTTFVAGAILTAAEMNRLPWGCMGTAKATANQTLIGATPTDITSLTVTFTANSLRLYRTTLYLPDIAQITSAGFASLRITDTAGTASAISIVSQAASGETATVVTIVESGLSGSTVRKGRASTNAGTLTLVGTATSPMQITVEDIGQA